MFIIRGEVCEGEREIEGEEEIGQETRPACGVLDASCNEDQHREMEEAKVSRDEDRRVQQINEEEAEERDTEISKERGLWKRRLFCISFS